MLFVPAFSRHVQPLGRSRYQTSGFSTTSEFPTELLTLWWAGTCTTCAESRASTSSPFPSSGTRCAAAVDPTWHTQDSPGPILASALANMAHIRQSSPDSGLGFQVKVVETIQVVCAWLHHVHHPHSLGQGLLSCAASERRGKFLRDFKDFCLKAKARIWPSLSYIYHIHSAALLPSDCRVCTIFAQRQFCPRP